MGCPVKDECKDFTKRCQKQQGREDSDNISSYTARCNLDNPTAPQLTLERLRIIATESRWVAHHQHVGKKCQYKQGRIEQDVDG